MSRPAPAPDPPAFDPACDRCPRIAAHLAQVRKDYPHYHAAPVPPFGDDHPALLIVGLGPGMHGANASGRPFTGDHAGIILYRMLHEFGYGNLPESRHAGDGLVLRRARISNAVKCLPPGNKPLGVEVRNCNPYLRAELESMPRRLVILALGRVAHESVLRALDRRLRDHAFAHNAVHDLGSGRILLDSYHCSRYNTQTGRLTEAMFREVFRTAADLIDG